MIYSAVDFSNESYADARDRIFALMASKVFYFLATYSIETGDLDIHVYDFRDPDIKGSLRTCFGMTVFYDPIPEGF